MELATRSLVHTTVKPEVMQRAAEANNIVAPGGAGEGVLLTPEGLPELTPPAIIEEPTILP